MSYMQEFFQGFLLYYIDQGGPIMWPLVAFSIIAVTIIIERFWFYYRVSVDVNNFVAQVRDKLLNGAVREAAETCEEEHGPIPNVLKAGLLKFGDPAEEIEKTMENTAIHEVASLERWLPILGSIVNISPMIGFLGTVVGMIGSFKALAAAGLSDPGAVAQGISVALITTAGGLVVAVFTMPFYNYFTTRVARFIREIESSTNVLLETYDEMRHAAS